MEQAEKSNVNICLYDPYRLEYSESNILVQTSMQLKQQQDMALIKTVQLITTLMVKAPKFFMSRYPKLFAVYVTVMRFARTGAKKSMLIIKKEAKNSNFK